jgi:hypothetical protein
MIMRRAQIQQMFIILSAILVIGATLFVGAQLLGWFSGTQCKANDANFLNEMTDTLDEMSGYGTRDVVSISVPCDAVAICFVNSTVERNTFVGNDSVITASVKGGVMTNIFLKTRDATLPAGYDERIMFDPPSHVTGDPSDLCFDSVGGEFRFRVEGFGNRIKISQYDP